MQSCSFNDVTDAIARNLFGNGNRYEAAVVEPRESICCSNEQSSKACCSACFAKRFGIQAGQPGFFAVCCNASVLHPRDTAICGNPQNGFAVCINCFEQSAD